MSATNAGYSTCPVCRRNWLVTPMDDCLLPVCGCFGSDTSERNFARPCESCGIEHFRTCTLRPQEAGEPKEQKP